jgi:hypothetical protein
MELLLSIVVLLDIIAHNEFYYLYSMKAVHDIAASIDFGITYLIDG